MRFCCYNTIFHAEPAAGASSLHSDEEDDLAVFSDPEQAEAAQVCVAHAKQTACLTGHSE